MTQESPGFFSFLVLSKSLRVSFNHYLVFPNVSTNEGFFTLRLPAVSLGNSSPFSSLVTGSPPSLLQSVGLGSDVSRLFQFARFFRFPFRGPSRAESIFFRHSYFLLPCRFPDALADMPGLLRFQTMSFIS